MLSNSKNMERDCQNETAHDKGTSLLERKQNLQVRVSRLDPAAS
jgi:hypothetical protein